MVHKGITKPIIEVTINSTKSYVKSFKKMNEAYIMMLLRQSQTNFNEDLLCSYTISEQTYAPHYAAAQHSPGGNA